MFTGQEWLNSLCSNSSSSGSSSSSGRVEDKGQVGVDSGDEGEEADGQQ